MVVCKYFLRGTCKFGTYCHYDHQVPSNYNYTNFSENAQPSTSILRQANFGNTTTQTAKPATGSNVDADTLVKSVVADMVGAEKGGQWPLSCYAPFKEKPAFPGFEDMSPEEIRAGFYEAQKTGTLDQYKQQLQMLLQNNLVKVRALQSPSSEVKAILQSIYSSAASISSGTYGQTTVPSSNKFGQQSSNTFMPQSKPLFGQGNEAFKTNTQQQSVFGALPTNNNIFGGAQASQAPVQTNIFATTPPNQNIFGLAGEQNQRATNIFANSGQAPNQNPNNIFAGQFSNAAPTFGFGPSTNVFAPTQTAQTPNSFTNSNQAFQQQPNIFAPQQQNMFAPNPLPQAPTNMFAQQSATPSDYSKSIFGGNLSKNPAQALDSIAEERIDESLYSKLEELTKEEREWFESNTFHIENIPDKPPTYEMCFKA